MSRLNACLSYGEKMKINIITATDNNGIIGSKNKLPWRMPSDLNFFKSKTLGQAIVMGSTTLDGLPGILPMRRHWVLSSKERVREGVTFFKSIEDIIAQAKKEGLDELWIIGGASIYEQFLDICTDMYMTLIDADIDGDTMFPKWNKHEFELVSANKLEPHPKDQFKATVFHWSKK